MTSASTQFVAIREWCAIPSAVGRYFKRLTPVNFQLGTPDNHRGRYLQLA
jgi:hypothetical protein